MADYKAKAARDFSGEKMVLNWMDKEAIDGLFRDSDARGIYLPRQPIYGFRNDVTSEISMQWYVINYHILNLLAKLDFSSMLEVGAAEGFTSYIAKNLLNVEVTTTDFSDEACERAREIFHFNSKGSDCTKLPYSDGEFDVVLASEMLEHVLDLPGAFNEIMRVARKAVVITVPDESPELIARNILSRGSSHVHSFTMASFDSCGYPVVKNGIISSSILMKLLGLLIEARPRGTSGGGLKNAFFRVYNFAVPLLRKMFNTQAAAFYLRADEFLSKKTKRTKGFSFMILKDKNVLKDKYAAVKAEDILKFKVPYHRVGK